MHAPCCVVARAVLGTFATIWVPNGENRFFTVVCVFLCVSSSHSFIIKYINKILNRNKEKNKREEEKRICLIKIAKKEKQQQEKKNGEGGKSRESSDNTPKETTKEDTFI